ncbi:MAG: ABC transporter permease [Turicibacter sp.]|nr:ABC transporter permease [Turicibacter sp.]
MSNFDIAGMCVRSLFKRKLRSVLTMLGVIIGTVAIIVTISLGLAVEFRFGQMIDGMGDVTVITVQNVMGWITPDGTMQTEFPELNDEAVRNFEAIPHVDAVLPVIETNMFLRSGVYTSTWQRIVGVRPETFQALGHGLEAGRIMQDGNPFEAVFGSRTELNFQDSTTNEWTDRFWPSMMGEDVDVFVDIFNDRIQFSYNQTFIWGTTSPEDADNAPPPPRVFTMEPVGLLELSNDWSVDQAIFMDIEFVRRMSIDSQRQNQQDQLQWLSVDGGFGHIDARANVVRDVGYSNIYVRATNIDTVSDVHEAILAMGYSAWYPAQSLNVIREMVASQQQMLGAIGAVSLFVAAIGIANTMVMSTYERTKEIGVMKVIGASLSDIRKLFLMEAAMIGFIGGVFGLIFSYVASYILNNHAQGMFMGGMIDMMAGGSDEIVSLIPPWLAVAALVFAGLIGLVSGYFPARRATKLSALNAIRTE